MRSLIKKVVLSKKQTFEFKEKGLLVFAEVDSKRSCFKFYTRVFSEKEFIPFSVKSCVEKNFSKKNKKIPLYLSLNEEENAVDLIQEFSGDIKIPVLKLLKLFVFAARSWAPILKKLAQQDLFFV